jgi:hypothetical protein
MQCAYDAAKNIGIRTTYLAIYTLLLRFFPRVFSIQHAKHVIENLASLLRPSHTAKYM